MRIAEKLLKYPYAIASGIFSIVHYPFLSFAGFYLSEIPSIFLILLALYQLVNYHQSKKNKIFSILSYLWNSSLQLSERIFSHSSPRACLSTYQGKRNWEEHHWLDCFTFITYSLSIESEKAYRPLSTHLMQCGNQLFSRQYSLQRNSFSNPSRKMAILQRSSRSYPL